MAKFTPGRSGNPKGRPRGSRNLAAQILAEVNETASEQQISKLSATIKGMVDKAVAGDQRATQMVIDRVEKAEATLKEAVERGVNFSDADRETIAEIHRRLTLSSAGGENLPSPGMEEVAGA